jgi:hypothetical protein
VVEVKPESERKPHEPWPDIEPGVKYVGIGGGMRGFECTALRQLKTTFGHKFAYVIWADKVPPGIDVDQNNGSMVRTCLLDDVRPAEPVEADDRSAMTPEQKESVERVLSPQALDQGYDDDYDPRG